MHFAAYAYVGEALLILLSTTAITLAIRLLLEALKAEESSGQRRRRR